jgi:hypothetical protein
LEQSASIAAALCFFMSGQRTAGADRNHSSRHRRPIATVLGSIACYELVDEPNFCVLPDSPHIINHTIPFNVIDLNGAWVGPSGERPYIYVYNAPNAGAGYTISVDQSLSNRPDGFGYFVNGSTISMVFPDDRDYTGTIEGNGRTIRWSNNTVWNKL